MGLDIWLLVLAVLVGWSFQEVTNCTLTGRYIPGSLCNVSKNDTEVQKAVLTGTYTFNNQSNDEFLFKAWRIDDAKRQIVKGIKYILEVQISRTVCRKTASTDLNNCHFQPEGKLHQIFHCHFEVWAMPWLKLMTTTFFSANHECGKEDFVLTTNVPLILHIYTSSGAVKCVCNHISNVAKLLYTEQVRKPLYGFNKGGSLGLANIIQTPLTNCKYELQSDKVFTPEI